MALIASATIRDRVLLSLAMGQEVLPMPRLRRHPVAALAALALLPTVTSLPVLVVAGVAAAYKGNPVHASSKMTRSRDRVAGTNHHMVNAGPRDAHAALCECSVFPQSTEHGATRAAFDAST